MMGRDWKAWAKAALIRAVKTFAQSFVGCIAVGAAMEEVQWRSYSWLLRAKCLIVAITRCSWMPRIYWTAVSEER